jgi:hypothetical protein
VAGSACRQPPSSALSTAADRQDKGGVEGFTSSTLAEDDDKLGAEATGV